MKKQLMFDRRTENQIDRGIEAINRLADAVQEYNEIQKEQMEDDDA